MDDGLPGAAMNNDDTPITPGTPPNDHVPKAPEWCLQRQIAALMIFFGLLLLAWSL